MICPCCHDRWAPRRRDKWVVQQDPFKIVPINEEAEKEYEILLMNDLKVPCNSRWCSIQ